MSRSWYCGRAAAALVIGCGGSDRAPSSPTPAVQPPASPPPPPSDAWTLDGRVVATIGGAPIANARVTPEVGTAVRTDAQLTEQELHHAKIAYSRPRGNTDPDRDPASSALMRSGRITH